MNNPVNKVMAIFRNHQVLDTVLEALNDFGFSREEISVLIKPQTDDIRHHDVAEVRAYSSNAYPLTRVRSQYDTLGLDTGADRDNRLEQHHPAEEHDVSIKDPNALNSHAVIGGALGLIAGAVALLIPGVGPALAAGPIAAGLAAMAAGTAVGTTAGALLGLFSDVGIPSDQVDSCRTAFEAGKGIVILSPRNKLELERIYLLLERHHPERLMLI